MKTIDFAALKHHLDIHAETFYDFCDRICTLSTGALALSITFRKDVVGDSPAQIWLLQTSWILWVISLVGCTFYRFSKAKIHWEIAQKIGAGESVGAVSQSIYYSMCFHLGVLSFLLATVSFVWFASINS